MIHCKYTQIHTHVFQIPATFVHAYDHGACARDHGACHVATFRRYDRIPNLNSRRQIEQLISRFAPLISARFFSFV